jgi:hypothetical protein
VRIFQMSIGFVVHGIRCSAGMDESPVFNESILVPRRRRSSMTAQTRATPAGSCDILEGMGRESGTADSSRQRNARAVARMAGLAR